VGPGTGGVARKFGVVKISLNSGFLHYVKVVKIKKQSSLLKEQQVLLTQVRDDLEAMTSRRN
jgi:hypothetical protein